MRAPFTCNRTVIDMKNVVDPTLASSSAATGNVVLELHVKRHCSAAIIASTRPTHEATLLPLDNGSASDSTSFGTPESADSSGSLAEFACDEEVASTHDAYESPSGPVPLQEQFGKDTDSGKSFRCLASRAAEWAAASTSCCEGLFEIKITDEAEE